MIGEITFVGFHIDQISLTFYYSNAYGPSFGLFEAWLYASVLDGPLLDQVFIICSSFICFSLFYTYYQRFFLSVLLDSFINIATVNVTFCFEIFSKTLSGFYCLAIQMVQFLHFFSQRQFGLSWNWIVVKIATSKFAEI